MDPMRLQKQLRDNNSDFQDYHKELQKWGADMKRKEEHLKSINEKDGEISIPKKKIANSKEVKNKTDGDKSKKPKDYQYWDKFDVDAECKRIDKEKGDSDSDLTDEYDEAVIDLAMSEKEKGNKFVKIERWEDAIKCYTSAIESYSYDATFYANRALCHLKLQCFKSAEADCTTALQIDKVYVKAMYRRALAREALGQLKEASEDLKRVMELEPENKQSQELLEKIHSKIGNNDYIQNLETQRPISKFTMSRNKQKPIASTSMQENIAIKENVIERINPIEMNLNKLPVSKDTGCKVIKESMKVSTTKENICWPMGDEIELISSIEKSPKERSKARLQRVKVEEVDIKYIAKDIDNKQEEISEVALKPQIKPQENPPALVKQAVPNDSFNNLNFNVDLSGEDFTELNLAIPNTAVQFYGAWKNLQEPNKRFLYLRQINPPLYTSIFKDSLDSKVFSEILLTLATEFVKRNISVFEYLYGLTKVRRFSTLVMFKNAKDKEALLTLSKFLIMDPLRNKEHVNYILKKYEF